MFGGHQTPCIDPIQEIYSFEKETNESMINENNYFINNDKFSEKSSDIQERLSCSGPIFSIEQKFSNSNFGNFGNKIDSTYDESYSLSKVRKSIFKTTQITSNNNKSEMNIHDVLKISKKTSVNSSSSFFIPSLPIPSNSNQTDNKNNLSFNLTMMSNEKKRGRKKCFPEGVKREVIDKAFLRQFKNFLRETKAFKNYKFDQEEKTFWTEFSQNNNPPIKFTVNGQKQEYKSFSSNLMKFIFSHNSVRALYDQFSKEKYLISKLLDKKVKHINDPKIKNFYKLYGSNMHKVYGMENLNYSNDLLDLLSNNNLSMNNFNSTGICVQQNDCDMSNNNIFDLNK